jgi:beta-glucosidase-like glycosyl hydrolase
MNPARLVFPAIRWNDRDLEEVWPEVRSAVELGVGGFVVFGGSITVMQSLVARAQGHAGRRLLFAADMERGAGQQLEEATRLPPSAALSCLDDEALIEAARMTAQEAASAGVGWVLGPVADLDNEPANPIIGTRSFGSGALSVAQQVRTWVLAAQSEGVHACAKHFPGHGRTTVDSHLTLPLVNESREELAADLKPFQAAIDVGVRSIMMAHVAYPALDPSGRPASMSMAIVGFLRKRLGFGGIVATDAMIMDAVADAGQTQAEAAVEAVALNQGLADGRLREERIASAIRRIDAAAESAGAPGDELIPAPSHARALEMAAATVKALRGAVPALKPGQRLRVDVVDDDIDAVARRFAGPGGGTGDRGVLGRALAERGIDVDPAKTGETTGGLVALFSELKGWKGRAGLAPASISEVSRVLDRALDATVVLFGHPRLADQLPAAANVICAWNGDPLMQEGVAQRLAGNPSR